jgi:hypothetical protein
MGKFDGKAGAVMVSRQIVYANSFAVSLALKGSCPRSEKTPEFLSKAASLRLSSGSLSGIELARHELLG